MRDYENIPRPAVEYHPHIRELIERQEVRTADRIYHQNKEKLAAERNAEIKDTKPREIKEFYCGECREDFFSWTIKQVEVDWTNKTQYIAFYRAKCARGHWCQRLITDRFRDNFYYRSRKVHRDRGVHYADTVQPHETGFQLLYGRKNASV